MAKEDNDLIDNAVDSAYEQLGDAAEDPRTTEPKEDAPSEVAKEQTEEPEVSEPEEKSTDTDQEANVETETATTEQVDEAISAPAFWTAETKALWNKVPVEAQKALAQEALRTQQQMGRLANESQKAKQWAERVNSDFSSKEDLELHRAQLRTNGITDEVAELHNYRAWSKVLKNDPLTAVQEIIAKHGITLDELQTGRLSEDQERFINDPRIDEVVNDFRSFKEQQEAERKAREEQETANLVNNWKSSPDKYGKPKAEFAALYAPQIDAEFQRIVGEAGQMGIQKSMPEFLDDAFYAVQERIYKAHGINPTRVSKTPEQIAADTAKAQAAVSKASGAPRTDIITKRPKKEYRNDKEWVEDVMNQAERKISGSQRHR